MKKLFITGALAFSIIGLVGCAKQKQASNGSKESHSEKKVASSESKTSTEKGMWDDQKAQKLDTFMSAWGKTMSQTYISYNPQKSVRYYGVLYPEALNKKTIKINGKRASIEWSENGTGVKDYEVVAIYSDVKDSTSGDKHLYLFAIHDGKSETLVATPNQESDSSTFDFNKTENKTLKEGFDKLVQGKTPSISDSSNSSANSSDDEATTNLSSVADGKKIHNEQEALQFITSKYGKKGWHLERVEASTDFYPYIGKSWTFRVSDEYESPVDNNNATVWESGMSEP